MVKRKYFIRSKNLRRIVAAVDFIGDIFFNQKKEIDAAKIKKILLMRMDNLGDVIMVTPAIRELKKRFPKSKIDILLKSSTRCLLENNPHIDKIIEFNPCWLRRNEPKSSIIKTILKLRKNKYDLVIDFRGDPRHNLIAYLSKSKYSIGYGTYGLGFLLSEQGIPETRKKHEVESNLDTIRILGAKIENKNPEMFFSKDEEESAKRFFMENKIIKKDFVIAIHPGAQWKPRCWPKQRFAELADRLIENFNAKIFFFGGHDEIKLINEINNLMACKNNAVSCAGKTTIRQFAALVQKCNIFICNDSGPMHIASAVKTPVIALFGPQTPDKFRPYGKNNIVLLKKVDCHPCKQKQEGFCKEGLETCKGLDLINVKEVFNSVKKII